MKKIQPRIIKNNEASESNLREFYKEVIQFVVRINSLITSNSKEQQDFAGRTIYVWFYILFLFLFAQNFDFAQCYVFSAFTFNPSFFSINFVIDVKTRFAAFSLLTSIIQSSAYLTKFSSLAYTSPNNTSSFNSANFGANSPN